MLLDDEKLKLAVHNTANLPDGLDLLFHLITLSGCDTQGITGNERQDYYNKGMRDFGLKLRDLLISYAPEKYINSLKERINKDE